MGARFCRPTLGDLLGVFLLAVVVLAGTHRLFGDGDPATHVATGYWVLEHREIPRSDPFSTTHAGGEWFAYEWLADILFAVAHRAAGWSGVLALCACLIAAAHVLLYRFLVRRGDDAALAFCAVLAAASAASAHWLARPHLFTVLLLVLWTVLLDDVVHDRRRRRWLLALPPLAALWANLHGGFFAGPATLACYGAGCLLVRRYRPLVPALAAALAATLAGCLLNPWGWRLPAHLGAFLLSPDAALAANSEVTPATVSDRAGLTWFAFLALAAVAIACGLRAHLWRRVHPGLLLAFAGSAIMATRSIRHIDIATVFGAIVVAGGFSAWLELRASAATRSTLATVSRREHGAGGGLLAVAMLATLALAGAGRPRRAGFDPARFPVAMIAALRGAGTIPDGGVFAQDTWGGYVILAWPEAKVFVDGRWDMYGGVLRARYDDLYLARAGWSRALAESNVTWALLPPTAPLAAAMASSAEWNRWGGDGTAVVFHRERPRGPASS